MANKALDTQLLDRAISFAVKAHSNTERRGKGFPYIVHPMEAMEIVSSITADQELLAAAALHDTIEDTSVTVNDIKKEFGERVAKLVEDESDKFISGVSESDSWHSRKQAAIERLAAAPYDAKIVALGDKLSNMRAIYRDYVLKGDELWKIFHVTDVNEHKWYYRGLLESLRELADTVAYQEFVQLYNKVFENCSQFGMQPQSLDMSEYTHSGEGNMAESFNHSDGKHMIKLYDTAMPNKVTFREYEVGQKIMDLGIVTPAVRRTVTDGTRIGLEFDRINPKKSFARIVADEPERLKEIAERMAEHTKEIHSRPCDTVFFQNIKEHWDEDLAACTFLNPEEKARVKKFVHSIPAAQTCLHGDLHFGNMITDGVTDYWIDLGDFRYGNPLFDFGMFFLVTNIMSSERAEHMFHMPHSRCVEFWNTYAMAYFKGETIEEINKKILPFAALYLIHFLNMYGANEKELVFIRSVFA